ncbi:BON domain-containing protein [Methylobacterium sp. NEAU K]|uniref:BON domain-containing protein n=1 Tax=Methylobacterium sp. NEAU K TaxID=3064946 RepID=UPI002733CEEF|nr:BON domain-containing protein [Methylobacterium sp. NEAU K]MDP4006218.1 BON domain-containing protein [Methylobacterium sp. NEAU K]
MDDKTVQQHVVDELAFEPSVDAANIGVTVDDGVVTLSGHVDSYSERYNAERAVKKVKGVRAVVIHLDVLFPSTPRPKDEDLARRALQVLDWNAQVPKGAVQVKVDAGRITLSGQIEWQFQKKAAEAAVRRLSGVSSIINLIAITPKASAPAIRETIVAALKREPELEADHITVRVDGSRVTLEGRVHAWHERDVVERAAWAAPGVTAVEDRLAVA